MDPFVPPTPARPWASGPGWVPDGGVVARHPVAFERFSRYSTHVSGPVGGRPDVGHRGAFGTGNGRVFGFVGLADPLNTLHSLTGPSYDKRPRFFGDYAIRLSGGPFDEERAGRSVSAPVLVTRGVRGAIELDTVDFAPWTDDPAARLCFVRLLTVRNRGAAGVGGLAIEVAAENMVDEPVPGVLVEKAGERRLYTRFLGPHGPSATAAGKVLSLPLPEVAAGAEHEVVLSLCTTEGDDGVPPEPALDADRLLDETAGRYQEWEERLVQVDLPDPMVADFIDGMKMTLKVQTSASGATCPMSEYTLTWARDNVGPVMAMLDLGGHEDARGYLDYLWAGVRYKGDLANAYPSDLDVAAAPPPPDFDSMGPLSGRTAAETPSYMVILHDLYERATGDASWLGERWPLLRRCMSAVAFGPDGLLPFSNDETFRAAMNAAAGIALEYPHDELTWSANSGMLWLGAFRSYRRLADLHGRSTDADALEARRAEVEAGLLEHYLLPDGCISPFVHRDTLEPSPAPFEDVALQVTWSGWKDGDDPLSRSSLDCLIARLGRAPGVIASRIHESYADFPLLGGASGIYTGMLPGYTLAGLTDAGHPDMEAAFEAVRRSLDTSGNVNEMHVLDDGAALSILYDRSGAMGDYTARFRPWEGGIVLDAVLRYLVGFRPDVAARTLSFRPHLPEGWPRMAWRGLRAGPDRLDLEVEVLATGTRISVRSKGSEAWTVNVRWDADGSTRSGPLSPGGDVSFEFGP